MDNSIIETIEKLYDKAENYGKTTIRLGKLVIIYKTADIVSDLAVKLIVFSVLGLSLLFANIGLSIWLGQILGQQYLGFLAVAALYLILAILSFVFRQAFIKTPVSNYVISAIKKELP